MNGKKVLSLAKKLLAVCLAAGMAAAGSMAVPEKAEAAVAEDKVIYDNSYAIEDYWKKDSKTAPVKAGYVFGGWYSGEQEGDYLTAEMIDTNTDGNIDFTGTVYAKFVPAQVLSVKAQNMAGTEVDTPSTSVRVISSMDSANYQRAGFDIWLANRKQLFKDQDTKAPLETEKIYKGLMVGTKPVDAEVIFGGVSKFVSVWQLTNIDKSNYDKIIYVRPYWITMDGTKVEGLAKYVHIEDEYKKYISVPVNLLDKEAVAAGAVNMTYENNSNEALELVEFEPGRVLPEMDYSYDGAGRTIKMVGNAATVDQYESAESLYANVRFKKPVAGTSFHMELVQFRDWEEKVVTLEKVWDVKYDVQDNTGE